MLETSLDPRAILRLQSWQIDAPPPAALEETLGLEVQRTVGAVTQVGPHTQLFCTGPTDWLLLAAAADSDQLLATLTPALAAHPYRLTDVSSALARFLLRGAHATTVLSMACALDTDPAAFPLGRCARTRLAAIPVVLHRRDAQDFEGIVASSYRDYLLAWLNDAVLGFA
jgi:sarcosine oxidase, subunit gamma